MSEDWTSEWPTEPGYYWFYGRRWRSSDCNDFYLVGVHELGGDVVYVQAEPRCLEIEAGGPFIYKDTVGLGWWQKVQFPDAPKLKEEE